MLGRKSIKYYRKAGHWSDDGEWISGGEAVGTISASCQPLNQNEQAQYIKPSAGGESIYGALKLYSATPLRTSKQETAQEADEIEYIGRRYKVVDVQPYQSGLINHYKMIALEVDAHAD